jgi:integrase
LAVWRAWVEAQGVNPADERERAADWLAELADEGRSWAWIAQAHNALRWEWAQRGWADTLTARGRAVVAGIARQTRAREVPTTPLQLDAWRRACGKLAALAEAGSLRDARDRVIAVLGFLGALRVSDICGLRAEDVAEVVAPGGRKVGLQLVLRHCKGRPGEVVTVVLPEGHDTATSPVAAWRALRALAPDHEWAVPASRANVLKEGPISVRTVPLLARRIARLGGQDVRGVSAHSLRAGLAQALAARGASVAEIQGAGRWLSVQGAAVYLRTSEAWQAAAPLRLLDY